MNEVVIDELVTKLNINKKQIVTVINMLSEGATIPFIARYRKNETGGLDENTIKEIEKEYAYFNNLLERKEAVIRLIDEKIFRLLIFIIFASSASFSTGRK